MNNFEVIIASAYGRGDLIATELQTRGFQVGVLDFSKTLGVRPLAEIEGPFPICRPNPLLPAHLEWLMMHSFEEISNGFALWLKDGPLEFRGPLSSYYQQNNPALALLKDSSDETKKNETAKKAFGNFEDTWALQFAHSFAANEFRRSTECHLSGQPFPLHQPMHKPVFTDQSVAKGRKELLATGAQWIDVDNLIDVSFDKGVMSSIEFRAGEREVAGAKYWVWCLTSEETASLSKGVAKKLFTNVITSDWAWRRFQVHSAKSLLNEIVPSYVVMIDDLHFPWSYDNLIVLKRRTNELSDIWVRLPSESSQKPEQLKKFIAKLELRLRSRFGANPFEIEVPWSAGSPLFPIFEPETLKKFHRPQLRNFMYEGVEVLSRQDWSGRFQVQSDTLLTLQTMKIQEAARLKKEDKSDQALHAP